MIKDLLHRKKDRTQALELPQPVAEQNCAMLESLIHDVCGELGIPDDGGFLGDLPECGARCFVKDLEFFGAPVHIIMHRHPEPADMAVEYIRLPDSELPEYSRPDTGRLNDGTWMIPVADYAGTLRLRIQAVLEECIEDYKIVTRYPWHRKEQD